MGDAVWRKIGGGELEGAKEGDKKGNSAIANDL